MIFGGINFSTCSGFTRVLGKNFLRGFIVCLISLYILVYVHLLYPLYFPYADVLFDMLVGLLSSFIFFLENAMFINLYR